MTRLNLKAGRRATQHQVVELVYDHPTVIMLESTQKRANMSRIPMFETVYHDYQLTGNTTPIVSPMSSLLADVFAQWFYAMRVQFGGMPFSGSVLSPTMLQTLRNLRSSYMDFTDFAKDLAKDIVSVVKRTDVRALLTFGRRMRDPATNAVRVATPDG